MQFSIINNYKSARLCRTREYSQWFDEGSALNILRGSVLSYSTIENTLMTTQRVGAILLRNWSYILGPEKFPQIFLILVFYIAIFLYCSKYVHERDNDYVINTGLHSLFKKKKDSKQANDEQILIKTISTTHISHAKIWTPFPLIFNFIDKQIFLEYREMDQVYIHVASHQWKYLNRCF